MEPTNNFSHYNIIYTHHFFDKTVLFKKFKLVFSKKHTEHFFILTTFKNYS